MTTVLTEKEKIRGRKKQGFWGYPKTQKSKTGLKNQNRFAKPAKEHDEKKVMHEIASSRAFTR
jgi:hypothetical protein